MTLEPLRREVEPPRPLFGPWVPIALLASAISVTIALTFVVMTAPPREDGWEKAEQTRKLREPSSGCSGMRGTSSHKPVPTVPAVVERTSELAACMSEWADRSYATAAIVTARLRVSPDGKVSDVVTTGLDDRIVSTCIATTLRDIRFPAAPHVTAVQVEGKYVEGQMRVVATPLATEPPPSPTKSR